LPLRLILGKIGLLKITIPYTSLGSNPVEVQIEDIFIVVCKLLVDNAYRANN